MGDKDFWVWILRALVFIVVFTILYRSIRFGLQAIRRIRANLPADRRTNLDIFMQIIRTFSQAISGIIRGLRLPLPPQRRDIEYEMSEQGEGTRASPAPIICNIAANDPSQPLLSDHLRHRYRLNRPNQPTTAPNNPPPLVIPTILINGIAYVEFQVEPTTSNPKSTHQKESPPKPNDPQQPKSESDSKSPSPRSPRKKAKREKQSPKTFKEEDED